MTNQIVDNAVAAIHRHGEFKADIALVLGSGLGNFADALSNTVRLSFSEIPGFPVSTVPGHSGELVHGYLDNIPVLVNSGRVHFYEGYSLEQVVFPIHILRALGARKLILTNAAGSIRKDFPPGALMLINRLLNFTGHSVYPAETEPASVFDPEILEQIQKLAARADIPLQSGSYAGLNGPSYETPAEVRFLRQKQADAVGMSTVHESMAAYKSGLRILGISCLTNYAAGILDQPLNHEEVIETGQRVQNDFTKLLQEIVRFFAELRE